MYYEVTLLEADIKEHAPANSKGNIQLGLMFEGVQTARLEYDWDEQRFSALFHGHSADLPIPAHPVRLLNQAISELKRQKTSDHKRISDVFADRSITIDPTR